VQQDASIHGAAHPGDGSLTLPPLSAIDKQEGKVLQPATPYFREKPLYIVKVAKVTKTLRWRELHYSNFLATSYIITLLLFMTVQQHVL
jgi:hypothetical protein